MDIRVERTRRKTFALMLDGEGQPLVRAPLNATDEEISDFVSRHKLWLKRRLAMRPKSFPTLEDGTSLLLFGTPREIRTGKAQLRYDALYLPAERREKALVDLLIRYSASRMEQLTDEIAKKYGFRYSFMKITKTRSRWGSCSANKMISYTFRTAFLPDELARYLAVHELCHTLHMNHSAAFWKEVAAILPNFAALRKQLRTYEWTMRWLQNVK